MREARCRRNTRFPLTGSLETAPKCVRFLAVWIALYQTHKVVLNQIQTGQSKTLLRAFSHIIGRRRDPTNISRVRHPPPLTPSSLWTSFEWILWDLIPNQPPSLYARIRYTVFPSFIYSLCRVYLGFTATPPVPKYKRWIVNKLNCRRHLSRVRGEEIA